MAYILTDQEFSQLRLIKRLSADLVNVLDLMEPLTVALTPADALEAATNWIRVAHTELQKLNKDVPAINS